MDQGVIDGIVNGVGTESKAIGGVLKLLQSGNIRSYATWVVIGSVALLLVMGVVEGVGR
jgi:NADH-quinone oxidoreductase subunit L